LVIITGPSRNPDSSTQVVPGHFAVAVQRPPAGKPLDCSSSPCRAEEPRDGRFEPALADLQFSFAGNERGMPDGHAGTSVIAFSGPGVRQKERRDRARVAWQAAPLGPRPMR